jgi:hypothetical protein
LGFRARESSIELETGVEEPPHETRPAQNAVFGIDAPAFDFTLLHGDDFAAVGADLVANGVEGRELAFVDRRRELIPAGHASEGGSTPVEVEPSRVLFVSGEPGVIVAAANVQHRPRWFRCASPGRRH